MIKNVRPDKSGYYIFEDSFKGIVLEDIIT